ALLKLCAAPDLYTLSLHDALPIFRRGVVRLDPDQPGRVQVAEEGLEPRVVFEAEGVGMGEHGDAAGCPGQRDRLFDSEALAADVGGRAVAEVEVEGRGDVGYVAPIHHHRGDVRSPHRAVSGTGEDLLHGDVDPETGETFEDGVVSPLAAQPQISQPIL